MKLRLAFIPLFPLNNRMTFNYKPASERDLKSSHLWLCAEKLLNFDTVSNKSNKACADFIANELDLFGFKTQVLREPNEKFQVVAHIGPEEDGGLILSGHMDIVPFDTQGYRVNKAHISPVKQVSPDAIELISAWIEPNST